MGSIGNLCLLPPKTNNKASNNLFRVKLPIYNEVKLELLEEIKKVPVWDKKAIEDRKERLLVFAKEQWKDL